MADLPKRVQLSRAKGWTKPQGAIVVSRPGLWGNPFVVKPIPAQGGRWRAGGRAAEHRRRAEACVAEFRAHLLSDLREPWERMRRELYKLRGKDLCCWCKLGAPCHADVLLELANK